MTNYQRFLFAVFMVVWTWAAINPVDPKEWLLENFLVFLFVGMMFIMAKYFTFSNVALTLITIFFVLHLAGSHYSYTRVPFGYTLQTWLGETRNMYDRLMHILFGLLFAYPAYEIASRVMKTRLFGSYYSAFNMIIAFSAIYEILEWLSVYSIDPKADIYFVGAQGDVWDTQKDLALATTGALIALFITFIIRRYQKRKNKV